jgi:hypothetical protein
MNFLKALSLAISFAAAPLSAVAASCQLADIMFGDIQLDILRKADYETAIVRSATFKDPNKNFGALLGEITVDRGGFSIRDRNQVVVGAITPTMAVEGWDVSCDRQQRVVIKSVQPGVYVILNGDTPVGTIKGRFPKNGFGVQ